jgi:hypothetical protein
MLFAVTAQRASFAILPNSRKMNFRDQPNLWRRTVQGFLAD